MATPSAMFSHVTFISIPQSYRSSSPITCSYIHCSDSFQPTTRDWVGLFKVGWSSTKDYQTFVWAEPSKEASAQSATRRAVFKEYYLPKDDGEFYQFCYVDSSGQVRGLSSPFCFNNAEDQSFQIIPEDDMMVVTKQMECKELQTKLDHLREENQRLENDMKEKNEEREKMKSDVLTQQEGLRSALQEKLQENQHLKEEKEDVLTQMEGLNSSLQEKLQENQRLKEEKEDVLTQMEGLNNSLQEKLQENQRLKKEKEDVLTQMEGLNSSLQEKLQENQRLKKEKEDVLTQMKGLNNSLQEKLQENQRLKEEKGDVLTQMQGLNSSLQEKLQENQRLKEEIKSQTQKQLGSQNLNSDKNEERYNRSLIKINQLKEERSQMNEALNSQSEEITRLRARSRDAERELSRAKDCLQLLEVDLQTRDKEKQRLAAEVHRLQENLENQERLRKSENQEPTPPQDHGKAKCEALVMKLQDAEAKLTSEKEQSRTLRNRIDLLNGEIQHMAVDKNDILESCDQEKRRSSKFELQLIEMNEIIADKGLLMEDREDQNRLLRQDKEELERENQTLKGELERLQTVYSSLHTYSNLQADVSPTRNNAIPLVEASGTQEDEHLYEFIEHRSDASEEKDLVCRHCKESFPGITTEELEQHEQSHRLCPFCCIMCDDMDQGEYEDHVYGH